ncbi:MAG: efflux RND transporter periplasmic adaptor subunit [Gemmatimonadota bacterium]
MKSRHLVTIAVFLLGATLLGGVYLKLRDTQAADAENGGFDNSAVVDSARAAASSTVGSAFAVGIAVPVEAARADRGTFTIWVSAEGQATALRSAPLQAEVAGSVTAVAVVEGQFVRRGQLLASVDPQVYQLDLREAQGQLEQAEAEYQDLTLGDDQIDDPTILLERRRLARIRSGLAGAEARVEKAKYDLAKTEIRAPYSGRIANLAVDVGSRLSVGDSVATVVDVSSIDIEVQVLESEIAALEVGRQAIVRFIAFRGETFRGRVVTLNPVVNPESRYSRVTVRLENPEAKILPGMHTLVRIAGRLYEDRVSIPKDAIVERNRRDVVFVFEPDEEGGTIGRAKWRYVLLGLESEDLIEIVAPGPDDDEDFVEPGEVVLIGGHTTLSHDARVAVARIAGEDDDGT